MISLITVTTWSDLMLLIALDILVAWILMAVAMAVLLWSGLNFAKICEWILNKITRKTS